MNSFRRFLVFLSFSFTFGGFLFYAGAVVPIGSSVLGSTVQGFVTQRVTQVLNLGTCLTVGLLLWEIYASSDGLKPATRRVWLGLTLVIGGCCALLFFLHSMMDTLLLPDEMLVMEPEKFYQLHRIYLWTSTVQWLCSLPILWILVNCRSRPFPAETENDR